MLVSTFEILVKSQLPPNLPAPLNKLNRKVIQGYFLTIANVNVVPVTLSVVFTVKFPVPGSPTSFNDFLDAIDISGTNLFGSLIPEAVPQNNKARLTFTLPENTTGSLILQANILNSALLNAANFEARGYVEIFLSSLSGSDRATLLVTPEHRGTFYKDINGSTSDKVGLDQIAYALPVSNGGVFTLSNS
jgi:hypothetical protein